MCGIMGYVGSEDAAPILLDGLARLEYRGYDSAGVAVVEPGRQTEGSLQTRNEGALQIRKVEGRLARLQALLQRHPVAGSTGVGHTRWATHGRPSEENAHPHQDCTGWVVVVHNGIIENAGSLRRRLKQSGHVFRSETDTEVVPHLVEEQLTTGSPTQLSTADLVTAIRRGVEQLRGSFALVFVSPLIPDTLIALRQHSPLIVGLGRTGNLLASDIPALLPYTRDVVVLEEGEMAVIRQDHVSLFDLETGRRLSKSVQHVEWDPGSAEKGGYPHFMIKEIHEQSRAVRDTLVERLSATAGARRQGGGVPKVQLKLDGLPDAVLQRVSSVSIVACGTACHAGLVGERWLERLGRIPARVDWASEFRYRDPLVGPEALTIAVSQSGETADTLAALREAKRRGARTLAITNVVDSPIARESDAVFYTRAGPEVAVASTKAYMTQLVALLLLAIHLGRIRGVLDPGLEGVLSEGLERLPAAIDAALATEEATVRLADRSTRVQSMFYMGRGLDYPVSMEGALKLKEVSYIRAEAYAAGELKHGTLALIEDGVPVMALATQESLLDKMISNMREVKARGAHVIALVPEGVDVGNEAADEEIRLPKVHELLMPMVGVVPLQLFAYHAAVAKGSDVDRPRNLAKSVTVE